MEEMDLQKLTFFTEGNTFTGSKTKDWEKGVMLRYLVRPNKEAGELEAFTWKEDLCFDRAAENNEAHFPLNEEGLSQVQQWLQGEYAAL